ncbi:MAG: S26 family signal peptidase [Syntrophorhabdales bacterium]
MNPQQVPARVGLREGEWLLSGPAFIELLQATLAKGVPFRFRARGSSMHPFIKDGDVITVSPLRGNAPGLGDVVAFAQREIEKLVVHRVIMMKANAYFMKGDATTGVDSPVPTANVLGLVTRVERDHKRVFIGLGPERFFIALLARKGLMIPLVHVAAKLLRPIRILAMILSIPLNTFLN